MKCSRTVLSLCCLLIAGAAFAQSERFIQALVPESSYPKSNNGRNAVSEFENTVRLLDDEYDTKYKDVLKKLHENMASVREDSVASGDFHEAERLIALQVDLPRRMWTEPRRVWAHRNGSFEQLFNGLWIEFIGGGTTVLFQETNRTSQYVELNRIDTAIIVRLEKSKCQIKFQEQAFRDVYNGSWQDSESNRQKSHARRQVEIDEVIKQIKAKQKK
mgnify:CR=1 FL=1